MDRGLWTFCLALLLLALSGWKPGLPPTLEADEPAYYLAAESLVHDFDLRADAQDRLRLFESFPYLSVHNLIVMSDDGWQTLYFGKPYIYSLCAAPLVALFGVEGMVLFNMLLFVAMIRMGFLWLRCHESETLAALFSVGFFVGSVSWVYVFWLHPEVFNMFSGAACLFLGLGVVQRLKARETTEEEWATTGDHPALLPDGLGTAAALCLSSGALALGVYNKPMMAALGLPVCLELLRHRRWRHLGTWLVSAVVSVALLAALAIAFTGKPTAYLVDLRAGFPVHDPLVPPVQPRPEPAPSPETAATPAPSSTPEPEDEAKSWAETLAEKRAMGAGWWWLLRLPDIRGFELAEDLPYFFIGRHTGLFVHHPFVLLALVLFALHGRRRPEAWWSVGSAFLVAAFFLVFIPFNWHGGGGFVGNRYFVMVVPAFLFAVTRIRPAVLLLPAFVLAGLVTGPLVLAPHGLVVPQATLQAHVRNLPFGALPLEFSLKEIPGYHGMVQQDLWLWGRKDHLRPAGDELWIAGGSPELWIQSTEPLARLRLSLGSPIPGQRVVLRLGSDVREADLGPEPTEVVFEIERIFGPDGASLRRRDRRQDDPERFVDTWLYRLDLRPEFTELPQWRGQSGPYFDHALSLLVLEADDVSQSEEPGRAPTSDSTPTPDPASASDPSPAS